MRRVLLTGMSGTGKSTLVRELSRRGYRAIDTDEDGWSHWVNMGTGLPAPAPARGEYRWDDLDWVWNEERMAELFTNNTDEVLIVAGTAENQGKFYPHFHAIVLLSAPAPVILERLAQRSDNAYGATPRTRDRVLGHVETVEPLLRAGATHEIDTNRPLEEVVDDVVRVIDEQP